MRRLSLCVALAVVSARPLGAETILYATAASQTRIDGFRVGADGSLSADPVQQRATHAQPRRLITRGCTLYAAETDRVEVFAIHSDGGLELVGGTRPLIGLRPRDIDLAPDGKTLYVPHRKQNGLASYPLDDRGVPNNDPLELNGIIYGGPSSCVYVPGGGGGEDIEVSATRLYAAYSPNRVVVYAIDEAGRLRSTPPQDINGDGTIDANECADYSTTLVPDPVACIDPKIKPIPDRPVGCPLSIRRRISGPTGLALIADDAVTPPTQTLIIGTQFTHLLVGFTLDGVGNFKEITGATKKERRKERKKERRENRTEEEIRYIGLSVYHPQTKGPIIFATGYVGRIDAYRLDAGMLPKGPSGRSAKDVTSSPVRSAVGNDPQGRPMLYVAAGELDRIQAFRLNSEGGLDQGESPMMETNEIPNSFPNDVVLADITTCD